MLRVIQDNTPNQTLIEHLERLLDDAKTGELRSMVYVVSNAIDATWNGWYMDSRSCNKKILAELVLMQQDFTHRILASQVESATHSTIYGED